MANMFHNFDPDDKVISTKTCTDTTADMLQVQERIELSSSLTSSTPTSSSDEKLRQRVGAKNLMNEVHVEERSEPASPYDDEASSSPERDNPIKARNDDTPSLLIHHPARDGQKFETGNPSKVLKVDSSSSYESPSSATSLIHHWAHDGQNS